MVAVFHREAGFDSSSNTIDTLQRLALALGGNKGYLGER